MRCHSPILVMIASASVALAATEKDAPPVGKLVSSLSPSIRADDLKAEAAFLASDECAGRLTGTDGALRAAKYIAATYRNAGLQPLTPQHDDYFIPFEFNAGVRQVPGGVRLDLLDGEGNTATPLCAVDSDFRPLTFSGSGDTSAGVVFAGYGLVEPTSSDGYDSYRGVDVQDKIVLILRGLPEDITPERRQELALYAGDRYKVKQAADRGAKACLLVVGPRSPNGGKLIKFHESDRTAAISIPAVSVTTALADRILAPAHTQLDVLQAGLDTGKLNPHATAPVGAHIRIAVELERIRKTCRNVIGALPPTGDCDEYILVGAHYDHIGNGEGLGSLARAGEEGQIHNGADDNASGVSVVLELAAALGERRNQFQSSRSKRGVIFACWSGEELGLVGSTEFAESKIVPLEKIAAYLNFDMVGRLKDNKLLIQAVGSSPVWRRMVERRNVVAGFNLDLNDDPYLPTDTTAFYTRGVPGLAFFTGLHDDYNRPSDDAETLNFAGMGRIAELAKTLIEDSRATDVEIVYAKVERSAPVRGRMGLRAYTGIVPDFAAGDAKGLRVSDVRPGGPADLAGIKGGDVIVSFAGANIASLRDYADALVGAKVGQTVPVVVQRDDEQVTLTMTPTARPEGD